MRHFYGIHNLGNVITQDCAEHCYGCYGMPHVALGDLERAEMLFRVLYFEGN